ncbi:MULTISPECIES: hypothetical protein [Sorangium]|uniref:hypothetical protein n=1 Tax=Sorangium TaxID=39643 RepID=UPI00101A686A|nr:MULTISPECIES: hypothetical protein [Sorangium]
MLLVEVHERARQVAHHAVMEPRAALADGLRKAADGVAMDAGHALRRSDGGAVHERGEHL